MNIEIGIRSRGDSPEIGGDRGRQVFVVGNFSGDREPEQQGSTSPGIRNMSSVDLADIDAAIARLGPRILLDIEGSALQLEFAGLEDFHPDRLFRMHPAFRTITDLKQALADPARREAATALCRQLLGEEAAADPTPAPDDRQPGAAESTDDTLARLLGQPAAAGPRGNAAARAAVDRILAEAVAGSEISPTASAEVAELKAGLDAWGAAAMRELLRAPGFRLLEANWRSLQWLAEHSDCDPEPSLWLVDVGSVAAVAWVDELGRRIAGVADDPDLLVILHDFSADEKSIGHLQRIAEAASASGMTVFAGASPGLAGRTDNSFNSAALDASDFGTETPEAWDRLRHERTATAVGLAYPRFLLRQPYGSRSDPVDALDFEELQPAPAHEDFLWGSPGIVLASMFANGSCIAGDLPMVVYDDGSGQAIMPPSEFYLADSASDALLKKGIMALVSKRGATDIRIPRMQSIADPPTGI